jgi:hypothetical protein
LSGSDCALDRVRVDIKAAIVQEAIEDFAAAPGVAYSLGEF